jgi:hypothetical protein
MARMCKAVRENEMQEHFTLKRGGPSCSVHVEYHTCIEPSVPPSTLAVEPVSALWALPMCVLPHTASGMHHVNAHFIWLGLVLISVLAI